MTNSFWGVRKLLGDALIDLLSHQNLTRMSSTLETGGKIHYRSYGSKIAAYLSHFTDRNDSGVDANTHTDWQLALASAD